jgi:aldehyde dehydrogenase (NAD+)
VALSPLLKPSLAAMREPVLMGVTRPLSWRLQQLTRLEELLKLHEDEIVEALANDLGKAALEAHAELATVRREIKLCRRQLPHWIKAKPFPVDLVLCPGRVWQQCEPLGCVLIIAPWNYPFQLCIHPLVSALAAGNSVVLKPSEQAPHTAALIARILPQAFAAEQLQVVLGGAETAAQLLEEQFDHIFFTGSSRVGSLVMQAAAKQLTPVTLELGGKSPVIVLDDADITITARRLAWGKGLNAGQTCIAPDHVLVQPAVRDALVAEIAKELRQFYGDKPLTNPDLTRIVNASHFQRLEKLLEGARQRGQVLVGGGSDAGERRIEPTVLAVDSLEDPLMQEELFGPLLPVMTVNDLDQALAQVRRAPKPLALYLFSRSAAAQRRVLEASSSGGVVFNDVVIQAVAAELPFGGVGASGMGQGHGEAGFRSFSHQRSVVSRPFWLDMPLRYPPYGDKLKLMKWLM